MPFSLSLASTSMMSFLTTDSKLLFVRLLKLTIPSSLFLNSGVNAFDTAFSNLSSVPCSMKPTDSPSDSTYPVFEVITIIVFLKLIFLPLLSAKLP